MPLKFVIVDDEPLAVELIKQYALPFATLQLAGSFTDAVAAQQYLQANTVDLLFIDINMPDINGLDLVRSLPQKPMIIFTTAYQQFAIDSYNMDALDYLLKPVEPERFAKAVQKAIEYYGYKNAGSKTEPEALFVRSEYQMVKIAINEIEYIESAEDYVKIHLTKGRPVMTLMTLKGIMEKLPADRFMRIHRSYVLPVEKIISVNSRRIKLTTIELPVGDNYVAAVQDWVKGGKPN